MKKTRRVKQILDPIKIASTNAKKSPQSINEQKKFKIETTVKSDFLKFVKEKRKKKAKGLSSIEAVKLFLGIQTEKEEIEREKESNHWIDRGSKRGK